MSTTLWKYVALTIASGALAGAGDALSYMVQHGQLGKWGLFGGLFVMGFAKGAAFLNTRKPKDAPIVAEAKEVGLPSTVK